MIENLKRAQEAILNSAYNGRPLPSINNQTYQILDEISKTKEQTRLACQAAGFSQEKCLQLSEALKKAQYSENIKKRLQKLASQGLESTMDLSKVKFEGEGEE